MTRRPGRCKMGSVVALQVGQACLQPGCDLDQQRSLLDGADVGGTAAQIDHEVHEARPIQAERSVYIVVDLAEQVLEPIPLRR
jgi:hypothetical protein